MYNLFKKLNIKHIKIMKKKLLIGVVSCFSIFNATSQTITAPTGQNISITNPVDITGNLNLSTGSVFKFAGVPLISRFGANNLFFGSNAGLSTTTGAGNLFVGDLAGTNNLAGSANVFIGSSAGVSNTSGNSNLFLGTNAGRQNTTGLANIYIGDGAGYNSNAANNIFIGPSAGIFNTSGANNLFIGTNAGRGNVGGVYNLFMGDGAGYNNTNSNRNVFIGASAGFTNTAGEQNVFIGTGAGRSTDLGGNNTFVGQDAGYYNTGGINNTFIGVSSGNPTANSTITNATAIGALATATTSNTVVLGNAATTITGSGLGTNLSGLRFPNLTNGSPAAAGPTGTNGKVLSVDNNGNVILVQITGAGVSTNATGPAAESWKESDGYLYNNSTNGVVIKGTGLDGNSLIVKGGILSKEVNVKVEGSESWPDYVFKPNYKRMTLGEVEKFISINGHLPNIPSATEMVATGNNLGKTDVKLLEKVEELTLYLLEMKKANDVQAAELKALKQQVNKLRKK